MNIRYCNLFLIVLTIGSVERFNGADGFLLLGGLLKSFLGGFAGGNVRYAAPPSPLGQLNVQFSYGPSQFSGKCKSFKEALFWKRAFKKNAQIRICVVCWFISTQRKRFLICTVFAIRHTNHTKRWNNQSTPIRLILRGPFSLYHFYYYGLSTKLLEKKFCDVKVSNGNENLKFSWILMNGDNIARIDVVRILFIGFFSHLSICF